MSKPKRPSALALKHKSKEILRHVQKPAELERELRAFRRAARVLSSKHPRMIECYPKQWIAVYKDKVQARGRTFQSLMAQVDKKRLPRQTIIVRYIDKNQRTMILFGHRAER